jgi:hypothetical protein
VTRLSTRLRTATAVVSCGLLALATACSTPGGAHSGGGGTPAVQTPAVQTPAAQASSAAALPYNVLPLLKPTKKYLGVALPSPTASSLAQYATQTGKQPNIVEYYAQWGGGFDSSLVRQVDNAGGLAYMAWEPDTASLAAIGSGSSDAYITSVAEAAHKLNLPVAISFAHEMNGFWYPWGTQAATPTQFVKAWIHIHTLFNDAGATNVIWVWSPNIINPVPSVKLSAYYPGNQYVDWIGMIGYYSLSGAQTFASLYDPTMTEVSAFSTKPYLIAETSVEPGPERVKEIQNLFNGLASTPDVIGMIWFDLDKRADWRIENDAAGLAQFKLSAGNPMFGFDVATAS